jgi:hypothetical protein
MYSAWDQQRAWLRRCVRVHPAFLQIIGVQSCSGSIRPGWQSFPSPNKQHRIATGSEFVLAAFSRQNRPAPAHSGSVVSAAVIFLAVAVVIVTTPARALRQVVLENAINHFD